MLLRGPVHECDKQLTNIGYLKGTPPWMKPLFLDVDQEIVETTTCSNCHKQTLSLAPYYRSADDPNSLRSYRCLAVCQKCHHAEEF